MRSSATAVSLIFIFLIFIIEYSSAHEWFYLRRGMVRHRVRSCQWEGVNGLVVGRARARSGRIAAGTAWARLHRGSRAAFCGHGEHRKLRGELLALAFRAGGS